MEKRSFEVTSEIILKLLTWIENIFIYLFKGKTAANKKKENDRLKEEMKAAKKASIEGDADKVNMIVENIRLNKVTNEQVKKEN